jgi:hypothetical protein
MKKFVFLHVGFETPTKEIIDAWMKWFETIKDHTVDSGNPFKPGKEITKAGVRDLPLDKHALAGYTIVNAESMEEAVKIAQGSPMITAMRVYEAAAM